MSAVSSKVQRECVVWKRAKWAGRVEQNNDRVAVRCVCVVAFDAAKKFNDKCIACALSSARCGNALFLCVELRSGLCLALILDDRLVHQLLPPPPSGSPQQKPLCSRPHCLHAILSIIPASYLPLHHSASSGSRVQASPASLQTLLVVLLDKAAFQAYIWTTYPSLPLGNSTSSRCNPSEWTPWSSQHKSIDIEPFISALVA